MFYKSPQSACDIFISVGFVSDTRGSVICFTRGHIKGQYFSVVARCIFMSFMPSGLNARKFLWTNGCCRYFHFPWVAKHWAEPNSKILDPSHFDTKQETAQQILSKFWNIAKVTRADQSKLAKKWNITKTFWNVDKDWDHKGWSIFWSPKHGHGGKPLVGAFLTIPGFWKYFSWNGFLRNIVLEEMLLLELKA